MRTPFQRAIRAFLGLAAVLIVGTVGYAAIEEWDLARSLFFTVITITTIGYGDYGLSRDGEMFTTVVIFGALGVFTYSFGQLVEAITSQDLMRRRTMERTIRNLSDHLIICGMGRMGQAIAEQLDEAGFAFVAIDPDPERVAQAHRHGWLALEGDATDDDVLYDASIENARAITCTATSDAVNIVIALGARNICPKLTIICRAEESSAIKKLQRAGATRTISPIGSGAARIVNSVLKPNLADLFDGVDSSSTDVEMAEIPISPLMGEHWRTVKSCGMRHPSVAFVAIRRCGGELSFRLRPDERLSDGDVLIVAGEQQRVCEMACEAREDRAAA